ncbi:MAG: glycosyltransferase family 4 protein [Verrucomicrobiota bacterium]
MTRGPQVLFYTHYGPGRHRQGGGALAIWSTARALYESGVDVTCVFVGEGEEEKAEAGAVPIVGMREVSELGGLVRDRSPDLLHSFRWTAAVGLKEAKLLGIPSIYEVRSPTCYPSKLVHKLRPPYFKEWHSLKLGMEDRRTAHLAAHVLVPSQDALGRCRRYYDIPENRSSYAYNGIAHDLFYPGDDREATTAVRIVTAGRIARDLHIDRVIMWYQRLKGEYPMLELDILGDGNKREACEAMVRDLGLAGVRFHGSVPHARVAEIYRRSDIMVSASQAESFGNVVAEGMASGLPTVCYRVGSLPEVAKEGVTTLFASFGDDAAMLAHLRRLICDPELRLQFGLAAAARARREFSWERRAGEIVDLYGRLLD